MASKPAVWRDRLTHSTIVRLQTVLQARLHHPIFSFPYSAWVQEPLCYHPNTQNNRRQRTIQTHITFPVLHVDESTLLDLFLEVSPQATFNPLSQIKASGYVDDCLNVMVLWGIQQNSIPSYKYPKPRWSLDYDNQRNKSVMIKIILQNILWFSLCFTLPQDHILWDSRVRLLVAKTYS